MKTLIALVLACAPMFAQQAIDNSAARSVIPWTVREDFPGRCALGQKFTLSTAAAGSHDYTCGSVNDWHLIGSSGTSITSYTVATLPGSAAGDTLAIVTDASTAGSCAVGSGSALSLCRWSGSAWATVGGSGGSGTTINVYTVATLPATPASNLFAMVTDASPAGSCSAGGGAGKSLCFSSGSAWGPIGAVIDAAVLANAVGLNSIGGTANAITGTTTTAYPAYAANQVLDFIAAATNTGATTIKVNALATRAITYNGTNALTGGEIIIGHAYRLLDDGTRLQLIGSLGPNVAANQVVAGPASGAAGQPGPRALVALDIPNIAESQVTNLVSDLGTLTATAITANRTYYILPSGSGTTGASTDAANGWNGNVAVSTTVSDANNCTAIATPCLTLQGVETKIHAKPLSNGAIVTIYVADTANTGTDCQAPNTVTFTNPSAGLALFAASEQAVAGVYPPSYIYVYANPTSRTASTVAGNGCGVSATFSTRNAITADAKTALRVRGFQFEGFGKSDTGYSAAVAAEGGSVLYFEDNNCISSPASHNSCAAAFNTGSALRLGGTFTTSSNGGGNHSPFLVAFGATGYSWGPLATVAANTVINNSSAGVVGLFSGVDGSVFYVDRTTWTNTGANAYILLANLTGAIIYTEAYLASECPAEKCWSGTNNATGVTYQWANEKGFIDAECSNFNDGTCTATIQPSVHSKSTVGGFAREYASGGTNTRIFTGADTIDSSGCVSTFSQVASERSLCGADIIQFAGSTSGTAQLGVAAAAGTPNKVLLPTATGTANCVLMTDGGNPQQTSWTCTPTITGTNITGIPEAGLALTNNATNDVSTSKHGFTPILPNDAAKFLNGIGGYTVPTGSAGAPTFPPNSQSSTYQVLVGDFSACKTIIVPSGTFAITLVASGTQPATGQCIFVINYGTGVATITRSGQNLNGGTGTLVVAAGSPTAPTGAFIVSNGTDYFGQLFGSGAASGVTGSGTANTGAKFTGGTVVGNAGFTDDGTTFAITDSALPTYQNSAQTISPVGVLSIQHSTTDTLTCSVIGAATETNFATTYTIPANFLINNKVLRITFGANVTGTSGFTGYVTNFKLCASGTCLGGSAGAAVALSLPISTFGATKTTASLGLSFLVQGTAAAGGSANVITNLVGVSNQVPWIAGNVGTAQPVAFATNGALTVQVSETCQQNTAGNSITLNQMIVEAVN